MLIKANSGRSGGGTLSHVVPLSRDTWIHPSSEPFHSTPALAGDSANAKIVAYHSRPYASRVLGPQYSSVFGLACDGVRPRVFGECRVRPGMLSCRLWPSLGVQ